MSKISIVIPFIHEFPAIAHTIFSIQAEMQDSDYKWEIIAVENGIQDENTPKWFTGDRAVFRTALGDKRIRYLFDPIQCGPHARNTGARSATGDYVIFMDAHTGLGKNSIDVLANFLKDNPNVGGVSGLTSWSSYDYGGLGAYYELFLQPEQQMTHRGGPTLDTHMHGHYMAVGRIRDREAIAKKSPVKIVMGSQAYTMYRTKEFLDIGGYCDEARYYPHPEGYMPLKMWMSGKEMYVHLNSYHHHSLFPRSYATTNHKKILDRVSGIIDSETEDSVKLENIKNTLTINEPDETATKIKEYGGYSWGEHGHMNVYKIAYILGGNKWADICNKSLKSVNPRGDEDKLKEKAIEQVASVREKLAPKFIYDLDTILTMARKDKIMGMENWLNEIGVDPLK